MSRSSRQVLRLLSLRELADETGVPRSTWYTIVARGELPVVRIGERGIRVREDDFLEWVEQNREVAS